MNEELFIQVNPWGGSFEVYAMRQDMKVWIAANNSLEQVLRDASNQIGREIRLPLFAPTDRF